MLFLMCISAKASINSFVVNFISAISLMYYGNANLRIYNIIIGIFSIYTSFMQLIDLGIWLDLDCKKGYNKLANYLGPILTYTQPLVLFALAYILLNKYSPKNNNKLSGIKKIINEQLKITSKSINISKIVNFIYLLIILWVLIRHYRKNINNGKINCSTIKNDHIKWNWIDNTNNNTSFIIGVSYLLIALFNIIGINPSHKYIYIVLFVYSGLYSISYIYRSSHIAEIWCYVSNCVPLILLILQKLFPKYIN